MIYDVAETIVNKLVTHTVSRDKTFSSDVSKLVTTRNYY